MKEVVIPKKAVWYLLGAVAVIGLLWVGIDIARSSNISPSGNAGTPGAGASLTPTAIPSPADVNTADAVTAAREAMLQVMWIDAAEGQEGWASRVQPLCSSNGWAFYDGYFASQAWPVFAEQQFTTQELTATNVLLLGPGPSAGSVLIEVTLRTKYMTASNIYPIEEDSTYQIVMVFQDGEWLLDGPPPPGWTQ